MTRLFKEQIRSVTVKIRNKTFNNETYTDVCECILSDCKECMFLDMDQFGIIKCSKLSVKNVSRKLFYSSYLQRLSVYVETFDDCLCLLDGRLENLSSLTVRVFSLSQLSTVNDSKVSKELRRHMYNQMMSLFLEEIAEFERIFFNMLSFNSCL